MVSKIHHLIYESCFIANYVNDIGRFFLQMSNNDCKDCVYRGLDAVFNF